MHSQSALTELPSTNLAPSLLLDPVHREMVFYQLRTSDSNLIWIQIQDLVNTEKDWLQDTEEWRKSPMKIKYARYNHATVTVPGDMFPHCVKPEGYE